MLDFYTHITQPLEPIGFGGDTQPPQKKAAEDKSKIAETIKALAVQQVTKQVDAAAKARVEKILKEMEMKNIGRLEKFAEQTSKEQREKLTEKELQEQVEELLEVGDRVSTVAALVDFFGAEARELGITSREHFDAVVQVMQSAQFRKITLGQILKGGATLADQFPERLRPAARFLIHCAERINAFMGGARDGRSSDQITMGEFLLEMQGSLALIRPVIRDLRRTNFSNIDIPAALDAAFTGPQTLLITNPLFIRFLQRRGVTTPENLRMFSAYCSYYSDTILGALPPPQTARGISRAALQDMYIRVHAGRSYIAALTHNHRFGFERSAGHIEQYIGDSFGASRLTVTDLIQLSLFLQTAVPEPAPIPAAPSDGGGAIGIAMLQMKVAQLLVNRDPARGGSFLIHRGYRGLLAVGKTSAEAIAKDNFRLLRQPGGVITKKLLQANMPERIPIAELSDTQQQFLAQMLSRAAERTSDELIQWAGDGGVERMIEHYIERRLNVESMLAILYIKALTAITFLENEPEISLPIVGLLAVLRAFQMHRGWMQGVLSGEAGRNTALGRYGQAMERSLLRRRGLLSRRPWSSTHTPTTSWNETRTAINDFNATRQLPDRVGQLLNTTLNTAQRDAVIDVRTMCVDTEHPPTRQQIVERLRQSGFTAVQVERIVTTLQTQGHLPATLGMATPAPHTPQHLVDGREHLLPEDRATQERQQRQTCVTELHASPLVQHFSSVVIEHNGQHYRYVFVTEGNNQGVRMQLASDHPTNPTGWTILYTTDGTVMHGGTGTPPAGAEAVGQGHVTGEIHNNRAAITRPQAFSRLSQPRVAPLPAPPPANPGALPSSTGAERGGHVSATVLAHYSEHLRPVVTEIHGQTVERLTTVELERMRQGTVEERLAAERYTELHEQHRTQTSTHAFTFQDPLHMTGEHSTRRVRSWTERLARRR